MSCEDVKDLMDDRCKEPQNLHLEVQKMAGEIFFFQMCRKTDERMCVFQRLRIFSPCGVKHKEKDLKGKCPIYISLIPYAKNTILIPYCLYNTSLQN